MVEEAQTLEQQAAQNRENQLRFVVNVLAQHWRLVAACTVMGMLVNFNTLKSWPILIFGLVYAVTAIISKLLGCSLPAFLFNFNFRGALRIGMGMVPRGEVALIIAGIGLSIHRCRSSQRKRASK